MRPPRTIRRGVTLLEIILATSLMVPLLSAVFWFYGSTLAAREKSERHVRETQLARVIMDRIVQELRQATGFAAAYGTGIVGTKDRISINTVVIPDKALIERKGVRAEKRPGQFDLRQVDYYVAWDEVNLDDEGEARSLGLIRRERKTFNQLSAAEAEAATGESDAEADEFGFDPGIEAPDGLDDSSGGRDGRSGAADTGPLLGQSAKEAFDEGLDEELSEDEAEGAKQELYAPEIKYVSFYYHDGRRWWDSWEITAGNSLPQMVMVTIGFVPQPPDEEEIEITKDLLEDEDDVDPIPADRYVRIVRIPQADSLFLGPRLQKEMSSLSGLEGLE